MNWYPVEYEGTITWGDHSTGLFDDDDYFFYVDRPDQALKTAASGDTRQGTEIEFDAGETVDYWDNTKLGGTISTTTMSIKTARQPTTGSMARMRFSSACWVSTPSTRFTRNCTRFTQCSSASKVMRPRIAGASCAIGATRVAGAMRNLSPAFLHDNQLKVLIPHVGSQSASVTDNAWVYGDDEDEHNQQGWGYQRTNDGLLLTFSLRDPSKQVGFVGDLTINWGQPGTIKQKAVARINPPVAQTRAIQIEQDDEDAVLRAKVQKLKPADQELLLQGVKKLNHHLPAARKKITLSSAPPPKVVKPAGKSPNYGSIFKSAPDPAGKARKDKQRQYIMEFLKAHGAE